jgi:lysophospholipase L1-like esterase
MIRINRLTPVLAIIALVGYSPADDKPTSRAPRTVFLIGDSTVKNGSGNGDQHLWGWGSFIADHVDRTKARVQNRALGGRSSRTYLTGGLWDKVLTDLKPGDVVLIQFGHNDGGPLDTDRARASLKGVGDETREVISAVTRNRTVHTYGWYLRKYVADARAKGAIPIILSPVPRDRWTDEGKVARASGDYGKWAAEVARSENVPFVDLNEIVARHYEAEGQAKVGSEYFTTVDKTHTSEAGARLNAASVVEGLRALKDNPLADSLQPATASK